MKKTKVQFAGPTSRLSAIDWLSKIWKHDNTLDRQDARKINEKVVELALPIDFVLFF